jgi:hypothetical protein
MFDFETSIFNNDIEGVKFHLSHHDFDLSHFSNFALTFCLKKEYYEIIRILVEDERLKGDANHNNAFNSTIALEKFDISLLLLKNKSIYDHVIKNDIEIYKKLMKYKLKNNIELF